MKYYRALSRRFDEFLCYTCWCIPKFQILKFSTPIANFLYPAIKLMGAKTTKLIFNFWVASQNWKQINTKFFPEISCSNPWSLKADAYFIKSMGITYEKTRRTPRYKQRYMFVIGLQYHAIPWRKKTFSAQIKYLCCFKWGFVKETNWLTC